MSIAYFNSGDAFSNSPVWIPRQTGAGYEEFAVDTLGDFLVNPQKYFPQFKNIKHPQWGNGFFDTAWQFIKGAAPAVHKFVKDNKIISKYVAPLASKIPVIGPTVGTVGGYVADQLGYGMGYQPYKIKY